MVRHKAFTTGTILIHIIKEISLSGLFEDTVRFPTFQLTNHITGSHTESSVLVFRWGCSCYEDCTQKSLMWATHLEMRTTVSSSLPWSCMLNIASKWSVLCRIVLHLSNHVILYIRLMLIHENLEFRPCSSMSYSLSQNFFITFSETLQLTHEG